MQASPPAIDAPGGLALNSATASNAMRSRATRLLALSGIAFFVLLPLAKQPVGPLPAFVPIYQSALIVCDLVTAVLLLGQFRVRRSAGLGLLSAAYLFTTALAFVHLLTFPGAFAANGLLGAGPQSTAWLYMFWHAGFPLLVMAYAVCGDRPAPAQALPIGAALVALAVAAFALLATQGSALLPTVMDGTRYAPAQPWVLGTIWLSCLVALAVVWRLGRGSVLDLWLMVVLSAWFFDIGLAGMFNAARFDLGFYAGRAYGLLAASYVLIELLVENTDLHRREQARATELAAARDAALAADEAKSRFLATMSHEIRTPMNAILGLTHLALDTDLDARQRDYLSKVHAASKSLMRLLNDILDYSKLEAEHLSLEREVFGLETVLGNVADLFSARAEQAGVALLVDLDPRLPTRVNGDALRLSQALSNLVGNAIKFTQKGEVVLGAELLTRQADEVVVRFFVKDSGIGVTDEQISRLFRPFSQAEAGTARLYGGTGLGLAICKRLAELMGGSIGVTSAPGLGSVFSMIVRFEPAAGNGKHVAPGAAGGMRTLIVDPQPTSSRILRQMLESWRFSVTTVDDARIALEELEEAKRHGEPYQLVLLDEAVCAAGQGTAFAPLLDRLTAAPDRLCIVILVSSANVDRAFGLADSAAGVVTKPVTPSRLLDAIVRIEHGGRDVEASPPRATRQLPLPDLCGAPVLLVEDNPINQQVAADLLGRLGLAVTVVADGMQAVDRLGTQSFELVLMDLHMPVMDGLEATRLLRRLPLGAHVPVVAMTASALDADRDACLDAGMNDHLAKPFDPDELEAMLLRWIEPRDRSAGPPPAPSPTDAAATLAQRLPALDVERALVRMAGNQPMYLRMLAVFVDLHGADGDRVVALAEAEQRQELMRLTHALAGAAAVLGIEEVGQTAAELSTAAAQLDSAELVQRGQTLRAMLQHAVHGLRLVLPQGDGHLQS